VDTNKDVCAKMCCSVAERLHKCVNIEGKQLEYLRK
jgi:hypothetical protein